MSDRRCRWAGALIVLLPLMAGCASSAPPEVLDQTNRFDEVVELPEPILDGDVSLEEALTGRRSARTFGAADVPLDVVGQLLWAGQGVTDNGGHRTAPSAGARYPIDLYAIT
ncbi:MAG: nitroreductase family protein, partial [Acidimicrobiales bacterium]